MPTAAEKAKARQEARARQATPPAISDPGPAPPPDQPPPAAPAPQGDANAVRKALTPPASPRTKLYPRRITLDLTDDQDARLAALALELRPVGKAEILRTLLDNATDDEIRQQLAGKAWNR